uniref:Putative glutathione-regulated potassium-efflux system protein kefB n=1 Tax=Magnetococcus massalia (strain MO-1) TaxID=451514 RepID=A0A1S7LCS8_MAGMO|nr:Putative glutathione-regulated potassium-efflux system protein kefB [Candidatus Magnetococcus massalia]
MHHTILIDLTLIFGFSVLGVWLCHAIRIPPLLGFLVTGTLIGPHGFGLITSVEEVELLAEVGVMLLLFTIGLELSLDKLLEMRRLVLVGGGVQVGLSVLVAAGAALLLGQPANVALFIGFLVALSSTAIVLKMLQERGEVGSPHGQPTLGILIFQDLIVVPMLLMVPLLAGQAEDPLQEMGLFVVKALAIGLVVWFGARRVIPMVLLHVVRRRDPELFLLSLLLLGMGIALLTAEAGLSLALGAFLAGLVVSDSDYGHHALSVVMPFRDVFTSLFFVSVGMLMEMAFLLDHLPEVMVGALILLVTKTLLTTGASLMAGTTLAAAAGAGLALSQVGEFSFVLAQAGLTAGLLEHDSYQYFLSAAVVTMAITPVLSGSAGRWGRAIASLPMLRNRFATREETASSSPTSQRNHLLIIGFGANGRAVWQMAQRRGIGYTVLETNPDTVRRESQAGVEIHFGDASRADVLRHVGLQHAQAVVVTVPSAVATRHIVEAAKRECPAVPVVARTPYQTEGEALKALGAEHVVEVDREASVALITRILTLCGRNQDEVEIETANIRLRGEERVPKDRNG